MSALSIGDEESDEYMYGHCKRREGGGCAIKVGTKDEKSLADVTLESIDKVYKLYKIINDMLPEKNSVSLDSFTSYSSKDELFMQRFNTHNIINKFHFFQKKVQTNSNFQKHLKKQQPNKSCECGNTLAKGQN